MSEQKENRIIDSLTRAEILVPTHDFHAELEYFTEVGFKLNQIYPSDDPTVAKLTGIGDLRIRIERGGKGNPPVILLPMSSMDVGHKTEQKSPGGTVLRFVEREEIFSIPETKHQFEVRKLKDQDPWVIGRAGMLYRDLIPDRLGGGIIASHIRIPNAGPVPDMVHYHTVGFQLIYCYKGWVRLVYEDQGEPFILKEGDCVIQPPKIRHRVLEASEGLEVIEIGVPAEHMTTIDHEMELPTPQFNPDRDFGGQKFCHFKFDEVEWKSWRIPGFEFKETGVSEATAGVASVHVVKCSENKEVAHHHAGDIMFTFILEGTMSLHSSGEKSYALKTGDAFVIPPGQVTSYLQCSDSLRLLEVALPGVFKTVLV